VFIYLFVKLSYIDTSHSQALLESLDSEIVPIPESGEAVLCSFKVIIFEPQRIQ